jgi:prolyl-tRNA editing enzyme YbaK/EbsC (Cys-tRNA(Pro) deacylase)
MAAGATAIDSVVDFLSRHNVQYLDCKEGDGESTASSSGSCTVKTIIFLAGKEPVAVVLPLFDQVAAGALARVLGCSRKGLKLAPAEGLVAACGYPVGSVPPVGASVKRTIVDSEVMSGFSTVAFAESGTPQSSAPQGRRQLLIPVTDLLRLTTAQVAPITRRSSRLLPHEPSVATDNLPTKGPKDAMRTETTNDVDAAMEPENKRPLSERAPEECLLQAPWPPDIDDDLVTLECIVARRRKIAAQLAFLVVVPPLPPSSGGRTWRPASLLPRAWRHPELGCPAEVQLIAGKTLESNVGAKRAGELIKAASAGKAVKVTGRPKPHPGKPGALGR